MNQSLEHLVDCLFEVPPLGELSLRDAVDIDVPVHDLRDLPECLMRFYFLPDGVVVVLVSEINLFLLGVVHYLYTR